ncbi:MAG TPA: hypothetical protein VFD35_11515 [Pricia sp.]|nr:hypothetical protein [Pricia sp.]
MGTKRNSSIRISSRCQGRKVQCQGWIDVFKKSGAKYVIPVVDHHEDELSISELGEKAGDFAHVLEISL